MRTFNVFDAEFEYDDADPEGYRAGMHRLGPKLDGKRLGATVYEIPPGQSLCPYHYETEEEWLLLLQGELTVRHPGGEDVLRPGDVVAFPVGPAGAHKTTNRGDETVRLLMWSNKDDAGYCVYPDSNKLLRWAPGEHPRTKIGPEAEYYDDEPL
jgi:uncharacterized cupin superfamily protein